MKPIDDKKDIEKCGKITFAMEFISEVIWNVAASCKKWSGVIEKVFLAQEK